MTAKEGTNIGVEDIGGAAGAGSSGGRRGHGAKELFQGQPQAQQEAVLTSRGRQLKGKGGARAVKAHWERQSCTSAQQHISAGQSGHPMATKVNSENQSCSNAQQQISAEEKRPWAVKSEPIKKAEAACTHSGTAQHDVHQTST